MAVVVKLPVIGLQGFNPKRIRERTISNKFSVLRRKKSVIFANPPVVGVFLPVDCDVAE